MCDVGCGMWFRPLKIQNTAGALSQGGAKLLRKCGTLLLLFWVSSYFNSILHQIGESVADQREYQEKISILRKIYQEEMAAYEKACQEFKDPVLSLLEQQSTLRPVSQIEKEVLLANIQHRFQGNWFTCHLLQFTRSYVYHHLNWYNSSKTIAKCCTCCVAWIQCQPAKTRILFKFYQNFSPL